MEIDLSKYHQKKRIIDLVKANTLGCLAVFPIALVYIVPYILIWSDQFTKESIKQTLNSIGAGTAFLNGMGFFLVLIVGIVVHEAIHGLTWSIYAKGGHKAMKYGILKKMLTPYCHCTEPLKLKHYIIGAAMPGLLMGVLPAIIAIAIGSPTLLMLAIIFTLVAIGDAMIINLVRKEDPESLVLDHPSEAGCYILTEKQELEDKSETFDTWNNIAEIYETKFMDMDIYNESYDALLKHLPNKQGRILDVGCGPGNIARYLLKFYPSLQIVGIDIAENMLEIARKHVPTGEFYLLDARAISILNGQFDAVIAGFCIPYLNASETEQFLDDASEKLNNKGLLYLSFVEGDPASPEVKSNPLGSVKFYFHRERELQKELKTRGFKLIKSTIIPYDAEDNHTVMLFQKY